MPYDKTIWNPGGPPGISAENLNKIESGVEAAHKLVETDIHTPDQSQTAQASGTLLALQSFFANMLKRILGTDNWYDAPPATLSNLYWSFWTSRTSGTTQNLWGFAYGGMWVAVGDGGTILTSTNGITWTSRASGVSQNLWGVAYGGMWVAVGDGGTILTSPDGITWTSRASGVSQNLYGFAYGGGMWVAVGSSGTIIGTVPM